VTAIPTGALRSSWRRFALAIGPGVVVMLADTDAGSVITAAQSGAEWGYRLLGLQFAMIPLLYAMQELTIRLGLGTQRGFAELVRLRYGRTVAVVAFAAVAASCFGALATQLAALGGLAQALGAPAAPVVVATVAAFIAVASLNAYASVERVALALGLFELAFVIVAWRASPDVHDMARQLVDAPVQDARFLYLAAANIGTTFLPWAAFYQQSAMVGKGLTPGHLRAARLETLGGAILCQVVTAAILVAGAATVRHGVGGSGVGGFGVGAAGFASVGALSRTFTQALGPGVGEVVFAAGLCGSALVAALVAGLTVGWSFSETFGPRSAPGASRARLFAFVVLLVAAGVFVVSGADPIAISLAAGVANAVLLPGVLALLYVLARRELNGALALSPAYARILGAAFAALSAVALYTGARGLIG
jgi:Mn2+/Fe2+ NRAMP family transporter